MPTMRISASQPRYVRPLEPGSVLASTTMAKTMLPTSASAASEKYHQCGCMSKHAMVSLALRFFFGYGMVAS